MTYISKTEWVETGDRNGWVMPVSPWWKRLPIIRHVRTMYNMFQVERHYEAWNVGIRTGYDEWVLDGMWEGY
jgi:hypothetical protein